jgi:hypothetical protein
MHKFNQLNQGSAYLRQRKQRQRSTNMNIIEGFANPPGPGAYSCCSSDCTPRYGYCPPTFDDLQFEKDDDPSQRQAQMNKFNQLLSQYGSTYKNYMENVVNYVASPPTGLVGQNVVVSQEGGEIPEPCPMCPSPADLYVNVCDGKRTYWLDDAMSTPTQYDSTQDAATICDYDPYCNMYLTTPQGTAYTYKLTPGQSLKYSCGNSPVPGGGSFYGKVKKAGNYQFANITPVPKTIPQCPGIKTFAGDNCANHGATPPITYQEVADKWCGLMHQGTGKSWTPVTGEQEVCYIVGDMKTGTPQPSSYGCVPSAGCRCFTDLQCSGGLGL